MAKSKYVAGLSAGFTEFFIEHFQVFGNTFFSSDGGIHGFVLANCRGAGFLRPKEKPAGLKPGTYKRQYKRNKLVAPGGGVGAFWGGF